MNFCISMRLGSSALRKQHIAELNVPVDWLPWQQFVFALDLPHAFFADVYDRQTQ